MDPAVMFMWIPIVAIIMGIGSGIFRMWTNHEQEMARIRASRPVQAGEDEELRQEIARLRDTTTQYDMSVEHALVEIRHRLTTLERKTTSPYMPQENPQEQEAVVRPSAG